MSQESSVRWSCCLCWLYTAIFLFSTTMQGLYAVIRCTLDVSFQENESQLQRPKPVLSIPEVICPL